MRPANTCSQSLNLEKMLMTLNELNTDKELVANAALLELEQRTRGMMASAGKLASTVWKRLRRAIKPNLKDGG